ncbi:MAG TPA: S41 family peptidase [Phycisphaerales bacterium]|nr:S41 family peptidase [Phycisphaerales bacterium]
MPFSAAFSRLVRLSSISLFALLAFSHAASADLTPNWFREPAISPDGKTIVFVHGGDLYSVPVGGGRAVPLTLHPAHEARPVWSPDGSMIAFASDRFGNFDVFVMPATGGEARRLTFHSADDLPSDFSPDGSAVIFESSRTGDVQSALFPTGVLSQLYSARLEGGTPSMLLTTPALNARFDRVGARVLYEDRKGYESEQRKHHRSSIARDIWLYDVATGAHTKLTDFAGEDREPNWSPDERSVYFLSERNGDSNVYRMPLRANAPAEQLTFFKNHPVRHLTVARNGHATFSWHGDIYHLAPGAEPKRVPIEIAVDGRGGPIMETRRTGATEFAVSPNGKEVAFVVRGEIFVTSTEFATTRRITNTPEQERSVSFAPCGRKLIYAGERDGRWSIYEASLEDNDELYFFSATKISERTLVRTDAEAFEPKLSPDGKKLAYLHNRSTLRVMDMESGETVTASPGTAYFSYSDGDYWFEWSSDSEWIAVEFYNRGRAFFSQVGLVRADGSTDMPIDLSNSGYDDKSPRWSMKGEALAWASDRFGMRNHGSWGSQYDVVAAFLTQDAFDRFRLSREEYELRKELEDKRKKDEEKKKKEEEDAEKQDETNNNESDDAKDEEKTEEDDAKKSKSVEFDLKGIETRTIRLTIHASTLGDFALAPEGDRLYYLARFERGFDLWVRDFRKESTSILRKLDAESASMRLTDDGKTIFLLAGGSLSKIDAQSGEQKPINFAAQLEIDGHREREYLFEHAWRQMKQKFYVPDMHGVDWEFYRREYEPKLTGVKSNRAFADLLSEILGELNASHTGGYYRPPAGEGDARTASLGVFYDNAYQGDGVRIAEIMQGGPLDKADLPIEAGMIITHIDGVLLDASRNLYELLNRKAGQRVRLTLLKDDEESFDVVVRPVGLDQENELRYQRWVRTRRAIVEEASGGRLGYMHVRGMNDPSFRSFYGEVLGRHFDKEALIVDTRFNGGGWLHDDLVTFLSGTRYVDLYPRNDEAPGVSYLGDSARRWTKPSIVVMSEGNYSDAHFFPWAYVELGIGETVGMPVPGTATAVWWERLHTGDLIFGIPQVGTKGKRGLYLENKQLEPTHRVELDPVSAAAGRDTQVLESVRILLRQVDSNR